MGNLVLDQAIAVMGSQTALAKAIGKSQGHISKWLERSHVPAESVWAIEKATGIPRQNIRPDLYPDAMPEAVSAKNSSPEPSPSQRKPIMGCLKGMVTLPPDFDPERPFYELHDDWNDRVSKKLYGQS
jgi:DNA-binding transcriptional regulator YdaS (Cro superfamily)